MKTLTYTLAVLVTIGFTSCAKEELNDENVPNSVVEAFKADFPDAENEEWEKECSGDFEVEFYLKEKEYEAIYDGSGKQLEYEKEIKIDDLPQDILDYIKQEYPDFEIKEAFEYHKDNTVYYETDLYMEGKEGELFFDADNKLVDKKFWTEGDKEKDFDEKDCDEYDKDKEYEKEKK